MDLNHIKRKGDFVPDTARQQKRAAIDWETTGRDEKHNAGTEDGTGIEKENSHGLSRVGEVESDDDAGKVVEELDLRSTPPNIDVFACPHCETSFSKLGKLK
jgi:hypothetical protein